MHNTFLKLYLGLRIGDHSHTRISPARRVSRAVLREAWIQSVVQFILVAMLQWRQIPDCQDSEARFAIFLFYFKNECFGWYPIWLTNYYYSFWNWEPEKKKKKKKITMCFVLGCCVLASPYSCGPFISLQIQKWNCKWCNTSIKNNSYLSLASMI